jgi:uncharacterized protein YndB with AHSA1/START domain
VGRIAGPEPQISLRAADGTVRVATQTAAAVDEAWRALTEPARVEQWLGVLSGELSPGARVRLDFEDGDFFDLELREVAKPVLRWTWRFMGCGPRDTIELRVDEGPGDSRVTVTDHEPRRNRDDLLELGQGWRDFLTRLQRHLATGERSRYDWRGDVDVWIDLPVEVEAAKRIAIGSAAEWLPLPAGAANLLAADALVLQDGGEPAEFAIERLAGTGPASVRFDLRPAGVDGSLPTRIAVLARGGDARLAIGQTGFRDLPGDDAARRRMRERFAMAWLSAARRARALAEPAPVAAGEGAR